MVKGEALDFEIEFYEQILRERPNYIEALILLAEAYTHKKCYKKGLSLDKRLAKIKPKDPVVQYNLACSYALVNQKDLAIASLKKAIKLGYDDFDHLKKDADLKGLHGDSEFEKLLKL